MTVRLTGRDLTLAEVVAVARRGERIEMAEEALAAMAAASALAAGVAERGEPVYGLTTGLGVQKRTAQRRDDSGFSWRQIAESRAGVGPLAPPDVVRAAMLVFANQMAGATTCIRPVLAERLVQALNDGERPEVRARGSIGASDLAQMADLATAVFAGRDPGAGRGSRPDQLERLRHRVGGAGAGRRRPAPGCRGRGGGALHGGLRRQSLGPAPRDRASAARSGARAYAGAAGRSCSTGATCGAKARRGTSRTR